MANEGSLDCNERNMEEIGGRTQGWDNLFVGFPGGKLF